MSNNDCQHVDDFYEALKSSGNFEPVISQKTVGLFGGTRSSYTVPTSGGFVKVRCDNGFNTAKFSLLEIMFLGSMKGNANNVQSEGSSFYATNIKPLSPDGELQITTLTSTATVQLPFPALKENQ